MGWTFRIGDDTVVDLDRLPPDLFDTIAQDEPDASWYTVYRFPGASTGRLWRLYVAACKVVDREPGPEPVTLADTLRLLDRLEQTPDIEDLPMENGYPLDNPEVATGSSSGAPEDSDGLPTSPDGNPSETC